MEPQKDPSNCDNILDGQMSNVPNMVQESSEDNDGQCSEKVPKDKKKY